MFKYSNVRIIIVLTAFRPIPVTPALVVLTLRGFFSVFKHVAAQDQQNNNNYPTTLLQSAKTHLTQAANDLKTRGSQAALTAINMTRQDMMSAERLLNSSLICNNTDNLGFCATS